MLTTYPTDIEGLDAQGRSKMKTTPVMCKSEFTGDGLLRHLSAMEVRACAAPRG